MAESKTTGFTVDPERIASEDYVTLSGFPGVYRKGEIVFPEDVGLSLAEMRERVKSRNLPLKESAGSSDKSSVRGFNDAAGHVTQTSSSGIGDATVVPNPEIRAGVDPTPRPLDEEALSPIASERVPGSEASAARIAAEREAAEEALSPASEAPASPGGDTE